MSFDYDYKRLRKNKEKQRTVERREKRVESFLKDYFNNEIEQLENIQIDFSNQQKQRKNSFIKK